MSFKEVNELRKEGKLDEALSLARQDLQEEQSEWTYSALFWVLRDYCRLRISQGEREEALDLFQQLEAVFEKMDDANRYKHALALSRYLRFNYNDSLKSTHSLVRMKWAELLTCPAKRVQAFFTSFTGQGGRYNDPTNPKKWRLRCSTYFKELYFKNLIEGKAYNPLDAIALAIYARGDDFYNTHKDFVQKLHIQEENLFNAIRQEL